MADSALASAAPGGDGLPRGESGGQGSLKLGMENSDDDFQYEEVEVER